MTLIGFPGTVLIGSRFPKIVSWIESSLQGGSYFSTFAEEVIHRLGELKDRGLDGGLAVAVLHTLEGIQNLLQVLFLFAEESLSLGPYGR